SRGGSGGADPGRGRQAVTVDFLRQRRRAHPHAPFRCVDPDDRARGRADITITRIHADARPTDNLSRPRHGRTRRRKGVASTRQDRSRDVRSLADHIGYLSAKITFLLEATLGMINNEQNTIIKIFSVLAVALMPPTLVGTIYGMNFKHMPELEWAWGYPWAL